MNSGSIPGYIVRYQKRIKTLHNTPGGGGTLREKRDGRVRAKSKANGQRALTPTSPLIKTIFKSQNLTELVTFV